MVCRFAIASNPILRAKKALLTFCKRRSAEPFLFSQEYYLLRKTLETVDCEISSIAAMVSWLFFVCRDLWLLRFFELLRWFQKVDELFRKQLQKRLRSLLKLFHHLIQLVQFYQLFFVCLKRKRSNICSGFANSLKVYILEYVHQISCHVLSLRNYQSNIIIILLW